MCVLINYILKDFTQNSFSCFLKQQLFSINHTHIGIQCSIFGASEEKKTIQTKMENALGNLQYLTVKW